jgi:hypothetical protein
MCEVTEYLEGAATVAIKTASLGLPPALHQPANYLTRGLALYLATAACGPTDDTPARQPCVADYQTAVEAALASVIPMAAKLARRRDLDYVAAVMNNQGNAAFADFRDEHERQGQPPLSCDVPADQDLAPFRKRRRAR